MMINVCFIVLCAVFVKLVLKPLTIRILLHTSTIQLDLKHGNAYGPFFSLNTSNDKTLGTSEKELKINA